MMNDTTYPLNDLLALAAQLEEKRLAPPVPLPRHWDRDGPAKDHRPFTAPKRDHAGHGNAQAPSWNWRSKGN